MRSRFGPLPVLALLLAGPLLGIYLYENAAGQVAGRALADFDSYVSDQASGLHARLIAVCETLYALQAFYDSSETVTREEFTTYTAGILARHRSIQAIEWVPRVPSGTRALHEAEVRRAGIPAYAITERDGAGRSVPAADREVLFPVCYVEPLAGNESAVGFDLGSSEVRRAALLRAADSPGVAFSEPIHLVQDADPSPAILAVIAIHGRPPSPDASTARGGPRGFVVVCVRADDLARGSFRFLASGSPAPMEFRLEDQGPAGPSALLEELTDPQGGERWPVSKEIAVGGRVWRLLARPTAAFLDNYRGRYPLTLGLTAFLGVELVLGLFLLLLRRSYALSLRKSADVVRSVFGSLSEGVVIADRGGNHLAFNDAARKMVGQGELDITATDWATAYGCYRPDGVTPYPSEQLPLARALRGETTSDELLHLRSAALPQGAWLSISGAPLRGARGKIAGGVIVMRDITRRRMAEEAVQRLSSAVEQTADVVFITSLDGRIEYANPAFETVFGFPREEVIGLTPRILRSGVHDEAYYRKLWETVLAGKVHRTTTVNRRKNGELVHMEQTITPMRDSKGDVSHFVSVAKDMTEARKRQEHEAELELAAQLQKRLYPAAAPRLMGLDVAGSVLPAAATSGDYWDLVRMGDGSVVLVIGDVCGHGLGPAMVMAETRAFLRSLIRMHPDLSTVLEHLNSNLFEDTETGRFVTLFVAKIDASRRELVYGNAGHVPAFVLDRAGAVRETLGSTGPALGVVPGAVYARRSPLPLLPGDLIVLLTDGITETRAPDGAFFAEDALLEIVRGCREEPAQRILERIHRATIDFAREAPQQDDRTVVVCKVAPSSPRVAGDRLASLGRGQETEGRLMTLPVGALRGDGQAADGASGAGENAGAAAT